MAKLSEDLKRILTGLAYQDAGDFLSIREKMKVLDNASDSREKPAAALRMLKTRPATKRIAFISNGSGVGAPLDYAIDACLRQNAQIDLLIHGSADSKNILALEKKIKNSAVSYQRIQFEANAVDGIVDYIAVHPSLIYLIAMPDDDVARVLIEDVLPRRRRRIQIPIVLIEDQTASRLAKQSAA
ncbi:MAG: hypothetical protein ACNYZG_02355 [Gammaproteobacteria bacterium]